MSVKKYYSQPLSIIIDLNYAICVGSIDGVSSEDFGIDDDITI